MIIEKKIFLLLIVLMLSFLVACDNVDTTQQEEQQAPAENQQGEMPSENHSTSKYEEFQRTLQDNPEYHVEYELTHSNGNKENVVIYTKDENTRMEIESDDKMVTVWMNGKNVLDYKGQCIDLDSASQFGFDPKKLYKKTTVEGTFKSEDKYLDVSSAGTKSIAGQSTNCFEFVYETSEFNQLTTYCLTDDGIPALLETVNRDTGESLSKAEATTLEDSVSDDVLEPCEPNVDVTDFI
ncbi:MAG: hypothetical protein ACLFP2_01900 [Candidatus Woesearchaeota archaeon]